MIDEPNAPRGSLAGTGADPKRAGTEPVPPPESMPEGGAAAAGAFPVAAEPYGDGSPSFQGFPVTKFHPVYGARQAKDPNEAAQVFQPPHDWFATAEQADLHRTDREAQQVMHHNTRMKIDSKLAGLNGRDPLDIGEENSIVRNSVSAQKAVDSGRAEPL